MTTINELIGHGINQGETFCLSLLQTTAQNSNPQKAYLSFARNIDAMAGNLGIRKGQSLSPWENALTQYRRDNNLEQYHHF